MKDGLALWLLSAAASLVAHAGLVVALSGLTLQSSPPALAELYIGDDSEYAPRVLAAEEETASVQIEPQSAAGDQVAAVTAEVSANMETEAAAPSAEVTTAPPVPEPGIATLEPTAPVAESETAGEQLAPAASDSAQPQDTAQTVSAPVVNAELAPPQQPPDQPEKPETATAALELNPSETAKSETPPQHLAAASAEPVVKEEGPKTAAPNNEPLPTEGVSEFSEIAPSVPLPAEAATAVPELSGTQAQEVVPTLPQADPESFVRVLRPGGEPGAPIQTITQVQVQPQAPSTVEAATAVPAVSGTVLPDSGATPTSPSDNAQENMSPATGSDQQVAALPSPPDPVPPRRERIAQFIKGYKGGKCFFARASGLNQERPLLDGFVVETEAIQEIGSAFKTAVGLEPEIAIRRVMEAQCPAVDFIRRLLRNRARPIDIELTSEVVPENRLLVGKVLDGSWPHTLLFIVDDDGMVQNLTHRMMQSDSGKIFSAQVHLTAQGRSRNQLIFAIGSSAVLDVPAGTELGAAAPFLASLQSQASAAGVALALGYGTFRIE